MRGLLAVVAVLSLAACEVPLGLDQASTPELENGAIAAVASARSLEIAGPYTESGEPWKIDLQVSRPSSKRMVLESKSFRLEAIVIGGTAYFRSPELMAARLAAGQTTPGAAVAVGQGWWRGAMAAGPPPALADFTDSSKLKTTFLNSALVARHDHVAMAGADTAELSGPLADVYIREAAPHDLIRLHMKSSTTVDGIAKADFLFSHYGADFGIVAPAEVVDFADLSTLPPNYTVLSVDGSGCGSPCQVNASVKNLGGRTGAKARSTVTFEMTEVLSGKVLGKCTGTIAPDVDFNVTTTVSCIIDGVVSVPAGGAKVTATPTNPGHV
jgi:hypothetical protein